jgi:putative ABC transport system ATP-binding protein
LAGVTRPVPGAAAIEFAGARRTYPTAEADEHAAAAVDGVVDLDLVVTAGEMVAVCGPSGSGKSTLLYLAGALDTPTEGSVRIEGHNLAALNARDRARLRNTTIGFVFQSFNLVAGLTAAENVALPAVLARRNPAEIADRVASLLDLVDLKAKTDRLPSQLSGGEQQRVAVARALINDPSILLADEPTGNLDTRSGAVVADLLFASNDAGRTVVVVTHDLRMAARATRIVHLRDGRVTHETHPDHGTDRPLPSLIDTGG